LLNSSLIQIYKTGNETIIGVVEGSKSKFDFRVKYKEIDKRERTPKHMHIIIDLYMKLVGNEKLTIELIDHIIDNIISKVEPTKNFPPQIQIFHKHNVEKFSELDRYGEYPIDFLLIVIELIQIQEKTNYPDGKINLELFKLLKKRADIFSVVNAATFKGMA